MLVRGKDIALTTSCVSYSCEAIIFQRKNFFRQDRKKHGRGVFFKGDTHSSLLPRHVPLEIFINQKKNLKKKKKRRKKETSLRWSVTSDDQRSLNQSQQTHFHLRLARFLQEAILIESVQWGFDSSVTSVI